MVAFGPVCGFLLGGFLLSFYVDAFFYTAAELNITPIHPRWVGAWWGGFLIIGLLLLLVSVPFFTFPKSLKKEKWKVVMEESLKNLPKGEVPFSSVQQSRANSSYGRRVKGYFPIKLIPVNTRKAKYIVHLANAS